MNLKRESLRWGVERRLEFVEFRLYWEGWVNRSDLNERFRISSPQASADLSRYQEIAPQNMEYDKSAKRYVATSRFKPVLLKPDSESYLEALESDFGSDSMRERSWLGEPPRIAKVPTLKRSVSPDNLRGIVKAIRSQSAIHIEYQSFSRPDPIWRWITPHAICHDGFRWHARSYCHRDSRFKDFLLSRVLQIGEQKPHEVNLLEDRQWNESVTLVIGPHPQLSSGQRKVVELDYGMINGRLEVDVKVALVYYVRKRFGLDRNAATKPPNEQHIVLLNAEDVDATVSQIKQRPCLRMPRKKVSSRDTRESEEEQ